MTASDRWHINMCTFLILMSTTQTQLAFWMFLGGAMFSLIATAYTSENGAEIRKLLKR